MNATLVALAALLRLICKLAIVGVYMVIGALAGGMLTIVFAFFMLPGYQWSAHFDWLGLVAGMALGVARCWPEFLRKRA